MNKEMVVTITGFHEVMKSRGFQKIYVLRQNRALWKWMSTEHLFLWEGGYEFPQDSKLLQIG
jgi:hypothetical protein